MLGEAACCAQLCWGFWHSGLCGTGLLHFFSDGSDQEAKNSLVQKCDEFCPVSDFLELSSVLVL